MCIYINTEYWPGYSFNATQLIYTNQKQSPKERGIFRTLSNIFDEVFFYKKI